MNPNEYAVGTLVTMTGTFKNLLGQVVDPTVVTAEISLPDRTVIDITANLTRVDVGIYTTTYTPSIAGGHNYQMQGTGNCQVASYGSFIATSLF